MEEKKPTGVDRKLADEMLGIMKIIAKLNVNRKKDTVWVHAGPIRLCYYPVSERYAWWDNKGPTTVAEVKHRLSTALANF